VESGGHRNLPAASQAFSWLGIAHLMMTLMDAPPSQDGHGESQELTVESFKQLDTIDG